MQSPRHPDGFRLTKDPRPIAGPRQRRLPLPGTPDLEVPLSDVTFCAVDLETTGGSARGSEIVEIGAVKARCGETTGTFQTLVRPNGELPVEIQLLTGIRPGLLADAEPLPRVLPSFLEFSRGCVLVAHNARFDHSFLEAACVRLDYERPEWLLVDTAKLARRILRRDVPNVRLHTLASFFRTSHTPSHRAFPDAAACLEVLWGLLERGAAYGVTTLADLLELQRPRSNPHFEKVKLARGLPRCRGVYLFRNARGEIVYIGKATDLRARVRSYFVSDDRKRMGDLRREATSVDVTACATDLEAEALEARLIEVHTPRYNRRGVPRRKPVYLKLTAERHPRFSVARKISDDGALYLGPLPSQRRAKAAADTLSGLFGLRTCTLRIGPATALEPCPLYALRTCHGPCTGRTEDADAHARAVDLLTGDLARGFPDARHRLAQKLGRLASQRRFEEAAGHRDAFADAARALDRARLLGGIARAGRIELDTSDGPVAIEHGRLAGPRAGTEAPSPPVDVSYALDPRWLGERRAVASRLAAAKGLRILASERPFSMPWPPAGELDRIEMPDSM